MDMQGTEEHRRSPSVAAMGKGDRAEDQEDRILWKESYLIFISYWPKGGGGEQLKRKRNSMGNHNPET